MAINIKPSHKGRLHSALGVPQGEKIPAAKLAKAKNSSSPALRKEATFAQNAKSFNHGSTKDSGKVKVAAMTPFGNKPKPQTKTSVKTDRGDFKIKG
jgi:hypothetical protein